MRHRAQSRAEAMALAPVQNTGLQDGPGTRHPQPAWEECAVPSRPTCHQRHCPLCALWRTLAGNTGARVHAVGASAGRANKPQTLQNENLAGKDGTVSRCWGRGVVRLTTGMRPSPPRRGQRTGYGAWVCPAAAHSRTPASRAAERGSVRPWVSRSLHLARSTSLAFPFEDVTRAQQPDLRDGQGHCAASCRHAQVSPFPKPQKAKVRRVGEVVQKTSTAALRNSSSTERASQV